MAEKHKISEAEFMIYDFYVLLDECLRHRINKSQNIIFVV